MRLARIASLVTSAVVCAAPALGCEGILGLGQATVIVGDGGPDALASGDSSTPDAGGDAAAPGADAAADGPVETSAAEGGGNDAAGVDANGGEAGPADGGLLGEPSAPCAQQPTANLLFCEDFDESPDAAAGWDSLQQTGTPGTMEVDTSNPSSPPNSLLFVSDAQGDGYLYLQKEVGTVTPINQWMHVAFDLRLDTAPPLAGIPSVLAAQLTLGASDLLVNYDLNTAGTATVQESSMFTNILTMPVPPYQVWTRIVIAYDAGMGLSVYEDGVLKASDTNAVGITPDAPWIGIGEVNVLPGSSSTMSLLFQVDNVVVRGQ